MSEQWQLRRGTTAENDNFTGAAGEVTMDTDTGALRVHDGVTTGGKGLVDSVIEFQAPTADNNHTWYRKYASGWVEQGGHSESLAVTLPVTMADTHYHTMTNVIYNDSNSALWNAIGYIASKTTTGFTKGGTATKFEWEVRGMAA